MRFQLGEQDSEYGSDLPVDRPVINFHSVQLKEDVKLESTAGPSRTLQSSVSSVSSVVQKNDLLRVIRPFEFPEGPGRLTSTS